MMILIEHKMVGYEDQWEPAMPVRVRWSPHPHLPPLPEVGPLQRRLCFEGPPAHSRRRGYSDTDVT